MEIDSDDQGSNEMENLNAARYEDKPVSGSNETCLIVGANRGIGLALVEQLLESPATGQVLATCRPGSEMSALLRLQHRHRGRLIVLTLDVCHDASLKQFGEKLVELGKGVDLTIHAAGMLHGAGLVPERSLAKCQSKQLLHLFEVNSIGPLLVAQALLPLQSRKQRFVFAALSAKVGSISDNRLGGWYGYRASKAALNQFIKTLANECRLRFPAAAVVAIHPGTTDTELSRPFQANIKPGKLYTPEQTARRILSVLSDLDSRHTGSFYHWDGSEIGW